MSCSHNHEHNCQEDHQQKKIDYDFFNQIQNQQEQSKHHENYPFLEERISKYKNYYLHFFKQIYEQVQICDSKHIIQVENESYNCVVELQQVQPSERSDIKTNINSQLVQTLKQNGESTQNTTKIQKFLINSQLLQNQNNLEVLSKEQKQKKQRQTIFQRNSKQQQRLQLQYHAKIASTRKALFKLLKLNDFIIQQEYQPNKNNFYKQDTQSQNKRSYSSSFQSDFGENLEINLIGYTENYQIIQAQCRLGIIRKHIKIYNANQQSPFHQNQANCIGSMANIYFKQIQVFGSPKFCIKCIKFNDRMAKSQLLLLVIKQHFINMIMGTLHISPQIVKPFAYNLIVFQDCVQFHTQICQNATIDQSFTVQQAEKDLKLKLFKIHSLKIIHLDIKPQNILFRYKNQNKKKSQALFIDFGLSRCIDQSLGQKSLVTNFCGTVGYTSKQMLDLLIKSKNNSNFVDLYDNDIQGLKKSLQSIRYSEIKYYSKMFGSVMVYNCRKQCYLFLLKYFLFTGQEEHLNQLLKNIDFENIDNFQNTINSFLSFVPVSNRCCQILLNKFKKLQLFQRQRYFLVQKGVVQPIIPINSQNKNIQTLFQELYHPLINKKQMISQLLIANQEANLVRKIVLDKQNLNSFITQHSHQAYYEIYMRFISYWNNACRSSLQERELAAQIFKQTIQVRDWILSVQVSNLIFSKNPFNSKSYQNLIFSIKYLLNYCYQNPLSHFSNLNYGNIVQQSLMLGLDFGQNCIFLMKQSFSLNLFSLSQCHLILKFFIIFLPFSTSILKYTSDNKMFQIIKNLQQLLSICLKEFQQDKIKQKQNKQIRRSIEIIFKLIPIIGRHTYNCRQHKNFSILTFQLRNKLQKIKKNLNYKNYQILFSIVGMCSNQVLRRERYYNYQRFNRQNLQHYAFKLPRKIKNQSLIIIQDFYKLEFLISSFEYKELIKQIQIIDNKINDSQISQLIKPQYRIFMAYYANDIQKIKNILFLIRIQNFPNFFNYSKNIYILQFSMVSITDLSGLQTFDEYLSIFQQILDSLTQQLLQIQHKQVRYYFDKVISIIKYYFLYSVSQFQRKKCELYFNRICLLQKKVNTQNCSVNCQKIFLIYYEKVQINPQAYLNTCIKIFQNRLFHTIQLTQLCQLLFNFLQHDLNFRFDQIFNNFKDLFKICIFSQGRFMIKNKWFSIILFQFLLQSECFKSICTFYRILIQHIRRKPSQQNIYNLMELLKQCHNKCWISFIFRKYYAKFLTNKIQKLEKLAKYLIVMNYAWSPFLTPRDSFVYLNIFQYLKSQKDRNFMINYISKCRSYLKIIDNKCICQRYYFLASELQKFSASKKKKLLKTHIKVSHFLFSKQYIFQVNGFQTKSKNQNINNHFIYKIKEKIIKYHRNFQNIFQKKQSQSKRNEQKIQFYQKIKEQKQKSCTFLTYQKKQEYKIQIKTILEGITKPMKKIFKYQTINRELIEIFTQQINE